MSLVVNKVLDKGHCELNVGIDMVYGQRKKMQQPLLCESLTHSMDVKCFLLLLWFARVQINLQVIRESYASTST